MKDYECMKEKNLLNNNFNLVFYRPLQINHFNNQASFLSNNLLCDQINIYSNLFIKINILLNLVNQRYPYCFNSN